MDALFREKAKIIGLQLSVTALCKNTYDLKPSGQRDMKGGVLPFPSLLLSMLAWLKSFSEISESKSLFCKNSSYFVGVRQVEKACFRISSFCWPFMRTLFMNVFVNTIRMLANILIASVHFLILSADAIRKLTNGRSVLCSLRTLRFLRKRGSFQRKLSRFLFFRGKRRVFFC